MEASMDALKRESSAGASHAMELEGSAIAAAEPEPTPGQQPSPDPQTLVDELVAAGEWPEPALMEKIIAAGAEAVAPLISVVRTYPQGWPAEATLDHAMTLLTLIRCPEAIPELIEVIRRYDEESGDSATMLLGSFGAIAFEPLLAFCSDPAVTGYPRTNAISAAIGAAGDDSTLRARLADVARPMLADAIERLRQAREEAGWDASEELDDDSPEDDSGWELEDLDDEIDSEEPDSDGEYDDSSVDADDQVGESAEKSGAELDNRMDELKRDVLFLVGDLAELADPGARALIRTAFEDEMVETFFVDEHSVERDYKRGGGPVRKYPDWLERYRESYLIHHSKPRQVTPRLITPPELRYDSEFDHAASSPSRTVVATIRHAGPQPGRNEPCWCGSGKKYKKCHLAKDTRS
jgi:hypothetical protein